MHEHKEVIKERKAKPVVQGATMPKLRLTKVVIWFTMALVLADLAVRYGPILLGLI